MVGDFILIVEFISVVIFKIVKTATRWGPTVFQSLSQSFYISCHISQAYEGGLLFSPLYKWRQKLLEENNLPSITQLVTIKLDDYFLRIPNCLYFKIINRKCVSNLDFLWICCMLLRLCTVKEGRRRSTTEFSKLPHPFSLHSAGFQISVFAS